MSWIREEQELDRLLFREGRNKMNFVKIGKRIVNLDNVQTMYYEQNGGLNYDSPCVVIDFGGAENNISIFDKYEPDAYARLLAWMAELPTLLQEVEEA